MFIKSAARVLAAATILGGLVMTGPVFPQASLAPQVETIWLLPKSALAARIASGTMKKQTAQTARHARPRLRATGFRRADSCCGIRFWGEV